MTTNDYTTGDFTWDQACQSIADGSWDAFVSNMPDGWWHSNVKLSSVKASRISPAGLTLNVAVSVGGTAWAGTAGQSCMPWQVAWVVSLYTYTPGTFIPNGRRRRGRFYLPPPCTLVLDSSGSGLASAAATADVLDGSHDFLEAVRMTPPPGEDLGVGNIIVFSRAGAQQYDVTDLQIDTRLDTQRRRANREEINKTSRSFAQV
jgi:hypothetical protein